MGRAFGTRPFLFFFFFFVLLSWPLGPGAWSQAPGEVQDLVFDDAQTLSWDAVGGADFYNVYRGTLAGVAGGDPARCHGYENAATTFTSAAAPEPAAGFVYLVTAESAAGGEGTPGSDSALVERPLLGSCGPVMRAHVLDRAGYGWDEWSRDRVTTLGLQGYLAEQLDPGTIDESTNNELKTRLEPYDPPEDIIELIARQLVSAVYARRQLEQQVATFWTNHFNTDWAKLSDLFQSAYPNCDSGLPQCDPNFPAVSSLVASLAQHRELEDFRHLGFNGNFRQILEASALSPAMILFLDTYTNVAAAPNENYARELLELYSMGVDGGYTQADVEELARVLTGWTTCKKKLNVVDDPLAECIEQYWEPTPEGEWTAHFQADQHDCGSKVLFQGTPQEVTVPDTCGNPDGGAQDLQTALDAIVAHPSTARFISKKILQRFVTDDPAPALIDDLVAAWNDAGNPQGTGDLRAVLTAALTHDAFLDPDRVRGKIKTPVEQLASALRAIRGWTDGQEIVLDYLVDAQHIPHYNPVPTGWPEVGSHWLDTTNTLERQNFCLYAANLDFPAFGSDPVGLLADNGVSTAPGNAGAIVDFFADVLFGGALNPAERQMAIDFLETDIDGTPGPYDNTRIRRTVSFLLGYPQFQEQ